MMASLRVDVAAAGIDLRLDAPGQAPELEQARKFQGARELLVSSSEEIMTLRSQGGIKDALGSGRKFREDVIEVLHGFLLACVSDST